MPLTNLLVDINDPTAGSWFSAGTQATTLAFAAAPDGTTTAFKIQDNEGGFQSLSGQGVPATPAATYTSAVWIKKTIGATYFPFVGMTFGSPASSASVYVGKMVDTDAGTLVADPFVAWPAPSDSGIIDWDADYWLVWMTHTNAADAYVAMRLYSCWSGASTGSSIWWSTSIFLGSAIPEHVVADFTGTPTSGAPTLSVAFTDASTGSPTSWAWTFGDGGTSTSQNPSHDYSAPGTYTVTLTATNAYGSDVKTRTGYIVVSPPLPVASFTGGGASGAHPLPVPLTDTSSHTPTSWLWDFGDGDTSTDQNPVHTYRSTGSYTITLIASNAGGDSSPATDVVTVTEAPATRADWRCQGARYAAPYFNLVAISSPVTRRVVLADSGVDTNLWADSGALAGAPGALVYGATLWTVCSDGYVRKLNPTTAALISSVNTYADTNTWLAINAEGVVIAPADRGKVSTISGTTVVDTIPVLPRIDAAVYIAARYLYCFGPNGTGAIVTVSAAGTLQKIGTFNATNCRDIRRAKIMPDGKLVVACKNRVVEFSIVDPTAPVVTLSTAYSTEVFSVADDNDHTTITADTRLGGEVPIFDATYNAPDYILVGPTPYVRVMS